jgi:RNA polymerase sigma factor (sigma-70 family)
LRSDEHLVDLVRAGDETAFEVLYERHVAGALGFCRHMLGSQDEAEDAVQQTFVSAHRDILRSSRAIAFKPWLYTIARNRSLSMLRARREQASEPVELSTAGLTEDVEQRSDLRELVADVQRLPDDQRAALVLSELGDLSHGEVAEVIGVEPSSVKGLVFRARSALIERREARQADCAEIREELASASGGGLRRSRLRYHLEGCPGCVAYLDELRRQRKLLGMALPVVPTLALQQSVMASVGVGAASTGAVGAVAAGGVATAGAPLLGGTLAKVAVVGVLAAGSAGVATEVVRDGREGAVPPAQVEQVGDERKQPFGGVGARRSEERSHGARGEQRRALGQRRARERSGGRAAAGDPRGKAVGRSRGRAEGRGQARSSPGKAGDGARESQPKPSRPTPAPREPVGGTAPPVTPSPAPPAGRGKQPQLPDVLPESAPPPPVQSGQGKSVAPVE